MNQLFVMFVILQNKKEFHFLLIHSHKYFLNIVDDYSRYTWIFLLTQKSEVIKTLENCIAFVQTQFETVTKIIRSDNETQFFMTNLFVNKGIVHQTSCVNTPQQNSIVERKHDHILNVVRALMIQSHLLKIYWSYSVIHVAHIIKMLPTPILNYSSPHEMLYKTATDFKVFGSLWYASTLSTNKQKFDPRASKCVFIGFKRGTKICVLLNVKSREIFVSRDVVFYENVFPYQRVKDTSNETNSPNIYDQILFTEDQLVLSQPSQAILALCDNAEITVIVIVS